MIDSEFDPNPNLFVQCLAAQTDGKILLGGWFTTLYQHGVVLPRSCFARLQNDAATQVLTVPDVTQTLWTRSGTAPELSRVAFDLSADSGVTWTALGSGTRIGSTSNWQSAGLSLPLTGQIRARGVINSGNSSGLIEQVSAFAFTVPPPTVTTQGAGSITFTGAMLSGTVNPNGFATSALFEYGLDTSYGGTASGTLSPNDGTSAQNVTATLTGLIPGTVYHYRLTATNAGGTASGADLTFSTLGSSGIAVEQPAGTGLMDGASTVDFGPVSISAPDAVRTFTVRNQGNAPLTGLAVTLDGPGAAEYFVSTSGMATTLHPAASTTFTVSFSPTTVGTATAALHIASNVAGSANPFDLALSGTAAVADDWLIVGSYEPDPAQGALAVYNARTNVLVQRITGPFASPRALLLSDDQSSILMSTNTGAGLLSYDFSSGVVSSFAPCSTVDGITRDHCGNVFITEANDNRFRVLSPLGVEIYRYSFILNFLPSNILFDANGWLLVNGRGKDLVPRYSLEYSGCQLTRAVQLSSVAILSCSPFGLAFDSVGNRYASCATSGFIKKISPSGALLGNFAKTPSLDGSFAGDRGLVWQGGFLYCINMVHNLIYKFGPAGGSSPVSSFGSGQLLSPQAIVVKKGVPPVIPILSMTRGPGPGGAVNDLILHIKANPGQTVRVMASADLTPASWTELASVQTNAAGRYDYVIAGGALQSRRFCRLEYNYYAYPRP